MACRDIRLIAAYRITPVVARHNWRALTDPGFLHVRMLAMLPTTGPSALEGVLSLQHRRKPARMIQADFRIMTLGEVTVALA